jgi:3-hydroxybutyryl-CoA dehydrogenase
VKRRERALGTHWWNPPFLVPLVEVIETEWTSPAVVDWTMKLHEDAGKTPAHVKKDVPGFIGNRLQHALWREAIFLVEEGICDAETVDTVVKASFGRRLPVLGPLENADLIGTDLTLAIHRNVMPHVDSRPDASPYLAKLVGEKKLGFKSGEGFRAWSAEEQSYLTPCPYERVPGTRPGMTHKREVARDLSGSSLRANGSGPKWPPR